MDLNQILPQFLIEDLELENEQINAIEGSNIKLANFNNENSDLSACKLKIKIY